MNIDLQPITVRDLVAGYHDDGEGGVVDVKKSFSTVVEGWPMEKISGANLALR